MYNLWYYSLNGRTHGPVTTAEIKRLAAEGDLPPDALLWPKGVDPGFAVEASAAIGIVPVAKPLPVPLPKWLDDVRPAEGSTRRKTPEEWPLPSWLRDVERTAAIPLQQPPEQWPLPSWLHDVDRQGTTEPIQPRPAAELPPSPQAGPSPRTWWPQSQDYNEAIQNPGQCFSDSELCQGEATTNAIGLPLVRSGNFADVYQLISTSHRNSWAIKCFTRQVPDLRERYAAISAFLQKTLLPFMVDFTYLDQGIKVRGLWFPILKMRWVHGLTLSEFVEQHADNTPALDVLSQIWLWLARKLREAGVGHCDLQHGNVLLVPPSGDRSLAIKLIDYDGMFVPALAQHKSGELGHPSYQHPQRLREGTYRLEVDRFSHLVIYTALCAMKVGGRWLWDRFNNGDNLLFRQQDFEAPSGSPLLQELQKLNDPPLRKLTETLSRAAQKPLEQTPVLDAIVGGG